MSKDEGEQKMRKTFYEVRSYLDGYESDETNKKFMSAQEAHDHMKKCQQSDKDMEKYDEFSPKAKDWSYTIVRYDEEDNVTYYSEYVVVKRKVPNKNIYQYKLKRID